MHPSIWMSSTYTDKEELGLPDGSVDTFLTFTLFPMFFNMCLPVCGLTTGDVDMCVQVQLLKESPAALSLCKLVRRKTVTRMNGIQLSHHISSRMGDTSCVKPTTTFPWWSQACKQQNTRPKLWAIGSRHKLWATTSDVWKQEIQEWLRPFAEGLTRGSSSSTGVSPADVDRLLSRGAAWSLILPPSLLDDEYEGGTHRLALAFEAWRPSCVRNFC